MTHGKKMTETTLINTIYAIAIGYDPDVDDSTSFQDIVKTLEKMKDSALKYELFLSSFNSSTEPQLPRINQCDI